VDEYRRHGSRTAVWAGTALAPSRSAVDADTEVWFALPSDSGRVVWEALNAATVGPGLAELRGVPAWVHGVHFGDVVTTVESAEGGLVGVAVHRRGAQATFRLWLGEDPRLAASWREIAERYAERGCLVDVVSEQLIALSCPVGSAPLIRGMLIEEESTTALVFEDGG
jgi:hypothetical protein